MEALDEEYQTMVTALAARVRAELVLPACVRHGMEYAKGAAGGGGRFSKPGVSCHTFLLCDLDDCILADMPDMIPIFDVLNLPVGAERLGNFVESVGGNEMRAAAAKVKP